MQEDMYLSCGNTEKVCRADYEVLLGYVKEFQLLS